MRRTKCAANCEYRNFISLKMYSGFYLHKTGNLFFTKKGFFKDVYFLSDDQSVYGELSHQGFFTRKAVVKTASVSWEFQKKGFFNSSILISLAEGIPVGELKSKSFKRGYDLQLTNGLVFRFDRTTFWSKVYAWTDERNMQLFSLKHQSFSKKKFEILLDKNSTEDETMLLLCFLGAHVLISSERREAAAAH